MFLIDIEFTYTDVVYFDFDGVLVDSVTIKTKAYQEIFKPFGQNAVDIVTKYHLDNGGIDRFKKIEYVLTHIGESSEKVDSLAEQFGQIVKDQVINSAPIIEMIDLVRNLYENKIPMFVVSGTPEAELREMIEKRNWSHYFKDVYGSPVSKIEIVEKIMQENKFNYKKSVFIGDAMTDYKTALHHKLWYIGVPEQ